MIAVLDYGAGNLASVVKAIRHLGRECIVTSDPDTVLNAEKLIIPGVGNFAATRPLSDGGLGAAVRSAITSQKPVLGICLGLQWMFEGSEEAAELVGLGVFPGRCWRFSNQVKSPHVGWNRITTDPAVTTCCETFLRAPTCISRIRIGRRCVRTQLPHVLTRCGLRRRPNAAIYTACNFIRRSRAISE